MSLTSCGRTRAMPRPAPRLMPTGTRSTLAPRRPWRQIPIRPVLPISATPTPTPQPFATDPRSRGGAGREPAQNLRLDRDAEEAADVGNLVVHPTPARSWDP